MAAAAVVVTGLGVAFSSAAHQGTARAEMRDVGQQRTHVPVSAQLRTAQWPQVTAWPPSGCWRSAQTAIACSGHMRRAVHSRSMCDCSQQYQRSICGLVEAMLLL
jgi:hypothetical protein